MDNFINVCTNCGATLDNGQVFCSKCGHKAHSPVGADVNSSVLQSNTGTATIGEKIKKNGKLIGIIAAATVIIALLAVFLIPKIFVSVDSLCAKGNYEKAYEKASDEEKINVRAENAVAVQSAVTVDELDNPDSFELLDAYYQETDEEIRSKRLVLYISNENESSYWLYIYYSDDKEWKQFGTAVSGLNEELYFSDDDKWEVVVNNAGRDTIKDIMSDGIKLSKDSVKHINKMFKADTLDDVTFLDID